MVTNLASSQNACLAGSYQPNSGQSSCLDADAGYFVANADPQVNQPVQQVLTKQTLLKQVV